MNPFERFVFYGATRYVPYLVSAALCRLARRLHTLALALENWHLEHVVGLRDYVNSHIAGRSDDRGEA